MDQQLSISDSIFSRSKKKLLNLVLLEGILIPLFLFFIEDGDFLLPALAILCIRWFLAYLFVPKISIKNEGITCNNDYFSWDSIDEILHHKKGFGKNRKQILEIHYFKDKDSSKIKKRMYITKLIADTETMSSLLHKLSKEKKFTFIDKIHN